MMWKRKTRFNLMDFVAIIRTPPLLDVRKSIIEEF